MLLQLYKFVIQGKQLTITSVNKFPEKRQLKKKKKNTNPEF